MPPIIVFSHLRWNFVFQRPQHLLSRLAQYHPILFIEEPVFALGDAFISISTPAPNVQVCLPHTPIGVTGFHDDQLPVMQKLVRQLALRYPKHIAWFYTPMALPLLQEMEARLVVYDCMDELSAFRNAPRQLLQRESALLKRADLVFTGGPSLHRAKAARHPSVHCFPSSVDVAHFERALDRSSAHPAHRDIPGPRLGFYGVIDERFDGALIAALADAHPQWQIVLVGPVMKIDAASLPRRANIHYLGQRSYEDLPLLLAGWDVCLLPFALNQATRYISPTKTLEYMAAERPVVSTAIADVADLYGDVVHIAADAASFIAACESLLLAAPEERQEEVLRARARLASTSWEATAQQMHGLIQAALQEAEALSAPAQLSAQQVMQKEPEQVEHIVIGAGPTGLSAAFHLDRNTLVLEREARVGGWCRSVEDQGFTFDHAGHIMFSEDLYVLRLYDLLLGDNQHWQQREAWVYSKGVHTRYPFQGALYGLPPSVIRECIMGAIEARYGATRSSAASFNLANEPANQTAHQFESQRPAAGAGEGAARLEDCCADHGISLPTSSASASASALALSARAPDNFEDFIYKTWGAGIARHFAIPYNRKLWTVPLAEMETSWLGGRVPLPDLEQIIEGALEPVPRPMGPNARFGYPLRGGFQALMNAFLPHIQGSIVLNAQVVSLAPQEHRLTLADGRCYQYQNLLSTMPLPELVKLLGEKAPEAVREAGRALRHISVRCVNLGVARENISEKHWIYYPEDTVFHRIFLQGNASPECNAPGGFGLCCEISYSPAKPLPCEGEALVELCRRDCIRVGMLREDDRLLCAGQVDMPYAYVVYDHARARNVALIREWLARHDILLAGRYSEWEYYNSDHAFLAGKKAAELMAWEQPQKSALAE